MESTKKWIQRIKDSNLLYDQLLIIDNGSTTIPDWTNTEIISNEQLPQESKAETVIFKFEDHLGRQAVDCYPGWYRSYMFAASYADRFGFSFLYPIPELFGTFRSTWRKNER